jgi:hypothetical protein
MRVSCSLSEIPPALTGRPELSVHLRGKALCDGMVRVANFGIRLGNLGIKIRPRLPRDHAVD